MIAYVLPIQNRRILWVPSPRFIWGEIKGLTDELVVLSPDEDVDVERISRLCHDQIYRPSMRKTLSRTWISPMSRYMMIWGLIWLIGMDKPLEDIISGLYLLIGQPIFGILRAKIFTSHLLSILARFKTLFHYPQVKIVTSPRLKQLEEAPNAVQALAMLDELGLGHLREIYKRSAWSEEWVITPPTGMGVLNA